MTGQLAPALAAHTTAIASLFIAGPSHAEECVLDPSGTMGASSVDGSGATACGANARAEGSGSTVLGSDAKAMGSHATTIGVGSVATRHTIALLFAGDEAVEAGERFVAALPDHEFAIPGQLVADAGVSECEQRLLSSPRLAVTCELLLLEEA